MPIEVRTGKPISSRIAEPLLASGGTWKGIEVFTRRAPPNELQNVFWETVCVGVVTTPPPLLAELKWAGERRITRPTGSGNVSVVPARAAFTHRWRQTIDIIHIALDPALLEGIDGAGAGKKQVELLPTAYVEDSLIHSVALALEQEIRTAYPGGTSYGESLGAMLAAHLVRRYAVFDKHPRENRNRLTAKGLRSVIEYIEDRVESSLSLHDLASIVGMNVYHFLRSFRRSTGLPPHQYVLRRRVERAKTLLIHGDLSIAEIALRCGFYSQSHLTTAFHRLAQVTPRNFRRAVGGSVQRKPRRPPRRPAGTPPASCGE
jgi:AraC family transcriptional regulator